MKSHIISFLLKRNHTKKKQEKSAKKAFRAFRSTVRSSDWYNTYLKMNGCAVSEIKTVHDFIKQVPLLSKESVFIGNSFYELVRCNHLKIKSVMLSSGQSGNFSTGVITRGENWKLDEQTDLFLDLLFGIKKGEALFINASSMGVRAFTKHTCCDTGPRPDIVLKLLKEVSPGYSKTVISADPHLIKQIAEDSIDEGIDWSKLKTWFISGGDWFPETLREYVHSLTGKSSLRPGDGFWSAIYGITELGYPLFFETAQLASLRSKFRLNRNLYDGSLAFKQGKCTTPFLFHYLQNSFFTEQVYDENNAPELVFTTLKPSRAIPLIRYNTHDVGELIEPGVFEHSGFGLPMVAFWGRNHCWLSLPSINVMITDIKELLFTNFELNEKITGFFTLQQNNRIAELFIQLKKGKNIDASEKEKFIQLLHQFYPSEINVSFEKYHWFEEQMELDFERKFNHLK